MGGDTSVQAGLLPREATSVTSMVSHLHTWFLYDFRIKDLDRAMYENKIKV